MYLVQLICNCITLSIRHRWLSQNSSTQGWYMPNVTQFIKMTIMVSLSNQLKMSRCRLVITVLLMYLRLKTFFRPYSCRILDITCTYQLQVCLQDEQ